MDLLQMRYVTAIADMRSMTKAAQILHVSQSALSLSCKRLETELGVQLFNRTGKTLRLTEAGELFCAQAVEILRLTSNLEAQLRRMSQDRNPPVYFGTEVIDFSNELITLFRQTDGNMDVQAENAEKAKLLENLRNGTYCFALTLRDHTGDGIVSTLLLDEPMLVLAGPTSHLVEQPEIRMEDLRGSPFVTTSDEYGIGQLMREYFQMRNIPMGKIHQVGDSDSIGVKVYNNFGISFVPETVVNLWVRTPQICIPGIRWLPVEHGSLRRRVYYTRTEDMTPSPDCEAFLRFLFGYSAAIREAHAYPALDAVLPFLTDSKAVKPAASPLFSDRSSVVHHDHLAVAALGVVTGEKQDRSCLILRSHFRHCIVEVAGALLRKLLVKGGQLVRGVQRRGGGARGDHVDADAPARKLDGHVLAHTDHRGLGGSIGNSGIIGGPSDGGDVDDTALPGLRHGFERLLHHVKNAVLVDLDDMVPPVRIAPGHRAMLVGNAGIVHQYVNAAKGLFCLFADAAAVLLDADIGGNGNHAAAQALAVRFHLFELVHAPGDQHQIGALLGKQLRSTLADPGVRSGDNGNLSS